MEENQKKVIDEISTSGIQDKQEGVPSTYTKDEADKKFNDTNKKVAETNEKIKKIDTTLFAVVIILLVMVSTLLIDSFHINSATYKEYAEKTDTVEATQKINQQLLEQNAKNQQMIIDLETQLLQKK